MRQPSRNLPSSNFEPQRGLAAIWTVIKKSKIACSALFVFALFFLAATYAPFLASSKPALVLWDNKFYFPLFRYLFYGGFYSKPIDQFFNLLMFTLPIGVIVFLLTKQKLRSILLFSLALVHLTLFFILASGLVKNPESAPHLKEARKQVLESQATYREDPLLMPLPLKKTWVFELGYMAPYEKLNALLRYRQRKEQHARLLKYSKKYTETLKRPVPTLWAVDEKNEEMKKEELRKILAKEKEDYEDAIQLLPKLISHYTPYSHAFIIAKYNLDHTSKDNRAAAEKNFQDILKKSQDARAPLLIGRGVIETYEQASGELTFLEEKKEWLQKENEKIQILIPPLLSSFHWQDDAGGSQAFNKFLPWWELTRINRKDLLASLIFGIRVSIIVGISAVAISLFIGILLGTISGYFAGKVDLVICRVIEIWEAMPTFFMLLLIVAITQSKSLFIVVLILGLFGWTAKCRFLRGEVLKQRNLPYVLACINLGFPHRKIMFSEILPNAIPPILTLLPFSMMAAISSEAGLSFLGLGEEGSTSWGVLMDEGRSVFPAESYLLWPPAILLTLLLVSIALIGDALRDALDPKMR